MKKNSKERSKIKAMIFDMDGTVVDSNKLDFDAWNKAFKEYEITLEYNDYIKLLGATSEEIIRKYLDLEDQDISKFIENKASYFKKNVKEKGLYPMAHIEKLLDQIKKENLQIALATGAQREKLDYMFEMIDLGKYFDVIVTADDVENGKPNPEVFLKAAEKLNVAPSEVIVWEDAEKGVEAAKNGNLYCIAITTTNGGKKGLEKADLIIDSFENIDLKHILNKFD